MQLFFVAFSEVVCQLQGGHFFLSSWCLLSVDDTLVGLGWRSAFTSWVVTTCRLWAAPVSADDRFPRLHFTVISICVHLPFVKSSRLT